MYKLTGVTKSDVNESMRNLDPGPKIINMISSGTEKVILNVYWSSALRL